MFPLVGGYWLTPCDVIKNVLAERSSDANKIPSWSKQDYIDTHKQLQEALGKKFSKGYTTNSDQDQNMTDMQRRLFEISHVKPMVVMAVKQLK